MNKKTISMNVPSDEKTSTVVLKNEENHGLFIHKLGLLNFFLQEYGVPKGPRDKGIALTAFDAIQNAHDLIIGLKEEINLMSRVGQGVDGIVEAAVNRVKEQSDLIDNLNNKLTTSNDGRDKGGDQTRENKLVWEELICDSVKEFYSENTYIDVDDLEHHVRGVMLEAKRSGKIKNSSGNSKDTPANPPIKGVKEKIKLAFIALGIDSPYPTRNKKG